jgi:hypothetical protein
LFAARVLCAETVWFESVTRSRALQAIEPSEVGIERG